jgi:flagellar biogenesis protein FliO
MGDLTVLRTLAALLIVLGLLGGLFWALRRFSGLVPGAAAASDLQILTWKPVDARRKLTVIRWGDEEHLILTSPSGDTAISRRPARPPIVTADGESE